MKTLYRKVDAFIKKEKLLKKGQHVLLAVSGGADSICMLHIFLHHLRDVWSLKLSVVHLNHGLRGKESDGDALFVRRLCKESGVDYDGKKSAVNKSLPSGESLENHARKVRYQYFQEIMKKINADSIATAHTRSDQVETIYMRKMTGAGLRGLRGILPRRKDGTIRPVLCLEREEIEQYCESHGLLYRTDASNEDTRFLRNRVRHVLLPRILKDNPSLKRVLLRQSQSASAKWGLIEKKVEHEVRNAVKKESGRWTLDLSASLRYPDFTVLAFCRKVCVRPSSVHVRNLIRLLEGPAGKQVKLPGPVNVWRTRTAITTEFPSGKIRRKTYVCNAGKGIFIKEKGLRLNSAIIEKRPARFPTENEIRAFFDAEKVGYRFIFRYWKQGDSFYPFGLKGRKKVSDFFREQDVPVPDRKYILMMESGGRIVWIPGFRIDDRFKVTSKTKKILEVYKEDRN